jgi:pilus assembly protein CpaF
MYAVVITDEGGVRRRLDFSKSELTVGRVQGNDIVLAKRNVSKQHARLTMKDDQAIVADLGSTNGTWVNGRKITSPHPLKKGDKIYIADFILTVEPTNDDAERASAAPKLSEPPPIPTQSTAPPPPSRPVRASTIARPSTALQPKSSRTGDIRGTSLPPSVEQRATDAPEAPRKTAAAPLGDPLDILLARLGERLDLDTADPEAMKNQERWSAARAAIAETFLVMQTEGSVDSTVDMRSIAHVALHEAVGLGALDDLISDDAVRGIVVNGPKHVFVDRGEGLEAEDAKFSSPEALYRVARRLASQSGQVLGKRRVVHGRLAFGPRVTILQAPLVAQELVIELRMNPSQSLAQLAGAGWLTEEAARYLAKAVAECRNIVVAGPQGSGVTQVMSALVRELPESESAVAVEAVPNLDIDRTRVVSLTAADSGLSFAETLGHGARLQSEHLIVNDLGGADTLAALTAVLGREPGHLLGVHCWSSKDAIEGLLLAATSSGVDRASISQLVGSTIDVVVATKRGPEGCRVTGVLEVQGHEAGDVSFQAVPF